MGDFKGALIPGILGAGAGFYFQGPTGAALIGSLLFLASLIGSFVARYL